jgi:hypothetical protein
VAVAVAVAVVDAVAVVGRLAGAVGGAPPLHPAAATTTATATAADAPWSRRRVLTTPRTLATEAAPAHSTSRTRNRLFQVTAGEELTYSSLR